MPILAEKNEYVVALTYECNWKCPYCAINNKHDYRTNITYDDIIKRINKIPSNSKVTLTGGEPGLIDRKIIEDCINILKENCCKIYLETNGLFIAKNKDLLKCFEQILYHCSIDMESIDDLRFTGSNFRYLLIVNDDNIKNLKNFLECHNDIKFDIIQATYPFETTGPTLSKQNKNLILAKFSKYMTQESIKRMIHEKDFDSITWLM